MRELFVLMCVLALVGLPACDDDGGEDGGGGDMTAGGVMGAGGAAGGQSAMGGAPAGGEMSAGGAPAGGEMSAGGAPGGGEMNAGGAPAGGAPAGGAMGAGGAPAGGAPAGGAPAGGAMGAGGTPAGGTMGTGGGTMGTGGGIGGALAGGEMGAGGAPAGGVMGEGGVMGPDPARHECAADGDCGTGTCQRVPDVPGATRYCVREPNRRMLPCGEGRPGGPGGGPQPQEGCCDNAECADAAQPGACIDFSVGYCGGVQPPMVNQCRYDACQENGDCRDGQACVPAGFGNSMRTCLRAHCMRDADCDARAGGQCSVVLSGPTCGSRMFFCTYDGDECRNQGDCRGRGICVGRGEASACVEEMPAP